MNINAPLIPKDLTRAPQWVCWKRALINDRPTKVPCQPDGKPASHSDPSTWGPFIVALDAVREERFPGVGFVLSDHDPFGGLDLDGCIDPDTQEIEEWAWAIIRRINSYTEVSPSGNGLRIFLRGQLPEWLPKGGTKKQGLGANGAGALEVYCRLRYLTVTGQHVEGTPLSIEERQAEFSALCAEWFPEEREKPAKVAPAPGRTAAPLALDDHELLCRMFASAKGAEILRLWNGDASAYPGKDGRPDHSAADLGLCNHLAFWCNCDQVQMDRLFRQSRLYREKWEREDYRTWTLDEACSGITEGYTGPAEQFDTSDLILPDEENSAEGHGATLEASDAADFERTIAWLKEVSGEHGPSEEALARAWSRNVKRRLAFFEGVQWYRYVEGCWRYSSQERVEAALQYWLVKLRKHDIKISITARKIGGVLKLARAYLGPHEINELNSRPHLIPLANGVYDLEREELLPHSPENWLTHHFPVEYEPTARCERWYRFLREVMLTASGAACEEWIRDLQEWFGYCLVPDNRAQVSMVWVGEGQNGKGVATRLLEAMVGSAQTLSVPVEQLHEPYHRADLHGKLIGFVNEPDPRAMVKNGAHFKAITGGDAISARRPTEKVFTFVPYCRLVISCNSIPATRDLSRGYFRRLRIIEWRQNIPEHLKETNLDSILRDELPGILNWALEGLRRFQARGLRFETSPESDALLADYKLSEDTLGQFIEWECERGKEYSTPSGQFYRAYSRWRKDNGHQAETETKVGRELKKLGHTIGFENDANGKTTRMRSGIRLRPDSDYNSCGSLSDNQIEESPRLRFA